MTHKTLDIIHQAYQQSIHNSHDILEILKNLYNILDNTEVCLEDSTQFYDFLDGLRGCIRFRERTFSITNLITTLNIVVICIIQWLNSSLNHNIDINLWSRRKSLESDLTKLLVKSVSAESTNIRDRFGLRGVVLNTNETEATQYVYIVYDAIKGIVAGKDRNMCTDFYEWYSTNPNFNILEKAVLDSFLQVPFSIDFVKDYIQSPTSNNYQSLQFSLFTPLYSNVLPGCVIEVQLRTREMHRIATVGSAAHWIYKDKVNPEIQEVFKIDSFENLHLVGFKDYDSPLQDVDGIHIPKTFADRRISTNLVKD